MIPRRRPTHQSAFTLLEVIVALALVAVMSLSLYTSLQVAFNTRRSAVQAVEPVAAAHAALEMIAADAEACLPPNGILAGMMLGTDGTGDSGGAADVLNFYTASGIVRPSYSGATRSIGLSSASDPAASAPAPTPSPRRTAADVLNVEYALSADVNSGESNLVRRVTRNLLSSVDPEVEEQVLCRRVIALSVRYFDGTEWLDEWDSSQHDNQIPRAVETVLEIDRAAGPSRAAATSANASGNIYKLSRVCTMPCSIGAGEQGTRVLR